MFQKLVEFFQSLFGGGKTPNPPTPPTPTPAPIDEGGETTTPVSPNPTNPGIGDEANAGDGSDLLSDPDAIGTVVFPEELVIAPPTSVDEPERPIEPVTDIPVIVSPDAVDENIFEDDENETPKHEAKYLWCLDNGHGKFTAGKRSPKFENGNRLFEYEFNRDIVKRICGKLDEIGVRYFNVVPEVDTDNFLKGRVDRANGHQSDLPKLFISIHSNAAPSQSINHWAVPGAKGAETWYYTGSSRGRKLASIFQKHIISYTGMVNRGLKSTRKLYVIKNTNMPAVLTENGFYNHQLEAQELMKDEVRQLVADAHVAAILEIEKNGL